MQGDNPEFSGPCDTGKGNGHPVLPIESPERPNGSCSASVVRRFVEVLDCLENPFESCS